MSLASTFRKTLTDPGRAAKVFARPLGRWLGTRNYVPTLLLGRSRSGSSLLLDMLNQHPRVDLRGEVLGRTRGRCAAEMVDEIFTRQIPLVRVAGFKVFYEHPIDDDSGELWDWLEQIDKLHVIHLRRQNILRSVLSLKLAQRTGRWGVRRGNLPATLADEPAIALDADELRQAFQQTRAFEAQARRRFAAKAMLEVRYRELTADAEAAYRRITDFLGIPYIQPKIRLQKQARKPLCEAIANYAQLQAAFAGTEWSGFFDETGPR